MSIGSSIIDLVTILIIVVLIVTLPLEFSGNIKYSKAGISCATWRRSVVWSNNKRHLHNEMISL
jgi:hypothetical protein